MSVPTRHRVGLEYDDQCWNAKLTAFALSKGAIWLGTLTTDGRWPNGRLIAAIDDGAPVVLTPNQTRRLIRQLEKAVQHMERRDA